MRKAKSINRTIGALGVAVLLALLNSQTACSVNSLNFLRRMSCREEVYLEFEFLSTSKATRTAVFKPMPRAPFSGGKGVEVGINLTALMHCSGPPVYVSPNGGQFTPMRRRRGGGAGACVYPIANRAGADTFGFVYSVVSKKVKGSFGPRLTRASGLPGLRGGLGTRVGRSGL